MCIRDRIRTPPAGAFLCTHGRWPERTGGRENGEKPTAPGVAETWQEKKWPNVTYFLSSVETVECEKKDGECLMTDVVSSVFRLVLVQPKQPGG